jgi:hypothetical protein
MYFDLKHRDANEHPTAMYASMFTSSNVPLELMTVRFHVPLELMTIRFPKTVQVEIGWNDAHQ